MSGVWQEQAVTGPPWMFAVHGEEESRNEAVQNKAGQLLMETAMNRAHPKEQVRVHVRWLIRSDLTDVLAIEQECFEYPWTEEYFLKCLRVRMVIGMVAEHKDKTLGYMVYHLGSSYLHVLNFAVAPVSRHLGIGSQMVAKLKSKLSERRTRITLAVRETNLEAQLFFRAQGFRAVRVLPAYYEDSGEDAYLMQYLARY